MAYTESKSPLLKYDKPHKVDCQVNGINVVASITGEYNLPIDFAYHVNFSDGFSAMFVQQAGYWWAERKGGKPYADAIKTGLDEFHSQAIADRIAKRR